MLSEAKYLTLGLRQNTMVKQYFVYIMTNISRTLYTGVTNDLQRRVAEHKSGQTEGFTSKYKIKSLVYFETTSDIRTPFNAKSKSRVGLDRRR